LVLLQNLTAKTIKLDSLVINNESGAPTFVMNGESLSYNAVAKQSEVFSGSSFITGTSFSDFSLDEKGIVKFKFSGSASSNLVNYKEAISVVEEAQ